MANRNDETWASESRLERQNSVMRDGFSTLPSDETSPPKPRSKRRRQPLMLRGLLARLAIVLGVAGVAFYALARFKDLA